MKPIPGFEGYYCATRDGGVFSLVSESWLTSHPSQVDGYVRIGLRTDDGNRTYLKHLHIRDVLSAKKYCHTLCSFHVTVDVD